MDRWRAPHNSMLWIFYEACKQRGADGWTNNLATNEHFPTPQKKLIAIKSQVIGQIGCVCVARVLHAHVRSIQRGHRIDTRALPQERNLPSTDLAMSMYYARIEIKGLFEKILVCCLTIYIYMHVRNGLLWYSMYLTFL